MRDPLVEVDRGDFELSPRRYERAEPARVWRSSEYTVVLYPAPPPAVWRLTVNRRGSVDGRYLDGVTWDELMRIKAETGFAGETAVELYPAEANVVDEQAMRHLWVLPEAPAFAWEGPL
jgi:hypothetical protein